MWQQQQEQEELGKSCASVRNIRPSEMNMELVMDMDSVNNKIVNDK